MKSLLALVALAWSGQAAAAEPLAFRADARVEVSAEGKPTRIEASADLPDAIRRFIEQKVATWQFSAPTRGGVTSNGVTYVYLGACAIPSTEGYRLALDFKGNGPRIAKGSTWPAPAYPLNAVRAGQGASMVVTYIVEPDGRVTLDTLEHTEDPKQYRKHFDHAIGVWLRSLRHLPEELAGQPVRTAVRVPIEFLPPGRVPVDIKQHLRDSALKSRECMAATGATGLQPVAVDSPIKVLTSG